METSTVMLEAKLLKALEGMEGGATQPELASKLAGEGALEISRALEQLKQAGAVESRKVGGKETWYALQVSGLKKVLIVEDDANINKLIKISIGRGFDVREAFDGRQALEMVKSFKPHLIILDLMLPGVDGLEVCRQVKSNPETKDTIVIIVSAADAAKNRLAGIKLGADYYIRKPFNPKELRSLTSIFLKKKGKKFDPLIDLPDEKRLSAALESWLEKTSFEAFNLKIENLRDFEASFGKQDASAMMRLVSQIVQDKVSEWDSLKGFAGYLGNGEFVIGGGKNEASLIASEIANEFERVLPFIYQGNAGKMELGIDDLFDASNAVEKPLRLAFNQVPVENILKKRQGILEQQAGGGVMEVGAYTYDQLRSLLGSENVSLSFSRDEKGVRIKIEKR